MSDIREDEAKKIFALGMKLNNTTPHTVFVHFMGHIDTLHVAVHIGGWAENARPDASFYTYTDSPDTIIAYLSALLEGAN